MMQWLRALALVPAVLAQTQPPSYPPPGAPTFAGDNPEGFVSPNSQVRYSWLRPVHWNPGPLNVHSAQGIPPATAAERARIAKTFDAVSGALQATPEGSRGRGFWVNESRQVNRHSRYEVPASAPTARWPLSFEIGFYPFYHEDLQQANGQWSLSRTGETESVYFRFNLLPGRVHQPVIATESQGPDRQPVEFFLRPEETHRVGGFPVYDSQTLVMARAGRDPWAPVPLGRLLKAVVPMLEADRKTAEQRLEGYKKANAQVQSPEWERAEWERFEKQYGSLKTSRPTGYAARKAGLEHYVTVTRAEAAAAAGPRRGDAKGAWYWNPLDALEEMNKRMASLTPDQAGQPACYSEIRDRQESEGRYQVKGRLLAVAGAPADCRPVAMDNPAYFDLNQGRAAAQIITIPQFGRCAVFQNGQMVGKTWGVAFKTAPPQGCYRHVLMWRDLDWSKIAALIAP